MLNDADAAVLCPAVGAPAVLWPLLVEDAVPAVLRDNVVFAYLELVLAGENCVDDAPHEAPLLLLATEEAVPLAVMKEALKLAGCVVEYEVETVVTGMVQVEEHCQEYDCVRGNTQSSITRRLISSIDSQVPLKSLGGSPYVKVTDEK